ncbi:hypothetical protein BAU15_01600 [Enterococcus sp. JM4C]|uniref:hypothetical protein n=1 Tax=Candidatus Enterococcus huntleyi TaxID=1857217 RepID=UPI00137A561F|nr:hypothetical protein [Enterococcus sp. JM4C]KAF1299368.1 hypothetical protein BAU15_01600 [Enterococcus sp. JM4C]
MLQGQPIFEGKLLGGCIDSLHDMLTSSTYPDEPMIIEKYKIFPTIEEWRGTVLFLETSEMKVTPEVFRDMLLELKNRGIFNVINGILFGEPQDETFYEEYNQILVETVDDEQLPIVCNINFGHAVPRCVLPIGVNVKVDTIN